MAEAKFEVITTEKDVVVVMVSPDRFTEWVLSLKIPNSDEIKVRKYGLVNNNGVLRPFPLGVGMDKTDKVGAAVRTDYMKELAKEVEDRNHLANVRIEYAEKIYIARLVKKVTLLCI